MKYLRMSFVVFCSAAVNLFAAPCLECDKPTYDFIEEEIILITFNKCKTETNEEEDFEIIVSDPVPFWSEIMSFCASFGGKIPRLAHAP